MASVFSVDDVLLDVATLSNCPAFGAFTRVTSTRATYWVAQSARSLSALLRQKFPEDREFLQYAELVTIPGFSLVSLPANCGEVHSVVWRRGAQDSVLLKSAGVDDLTRPALDDGKGWSTDTDDEPRWRLEGQAIAVYPQSGKAETVEVFYTSHLGPTSGTFQGRLDFDRWVTLDVCIKVATAKDKDAQAAKFQQQKALLENDMLSKARKRDVAEVHTMRDVRARNMDAYARRWGR